MILNHFQEPCLTLLFVISMSGSTDIPLASRIIGGEIINIEAFPYIAVVLIKRHNGMHMCGGGIIGKRWILTAGHCLWKGSWHVPNANLSVVVGVSHWYEITGGMLLPIVDYWVHSGYIVDGWYADIAIIRLVDELEYSDRVRPLFLPEEHEENDWVDQVDKATIAGYGDHDYNNTFDGNLRLIHVTIFADSKCRENPEEDKSFSDDGFICTGSGREGDRRTGCHGDSGSPVVVRAERGWVVLGVVSWANNCGEESGLSFHTQVSTFADWIITISEDFDKHPVI